jgi:hypothetical protein
VAEVAGQLECCECRNASWRPLLLLQQLVVPAQLRQHEVPKGLASRPLQLAPQVIESFQALLQRPKLEWLVEKHLAELGK